VVEVDLAGDAEFVGGFDRHEAILFPDLDPFERAQVGARRLKLDHAGSLDQFGPRAAAAVKDRRLHRIDLDDRVVHAASH
jgi:hypothetical protein